MRIGGRGPLTIVGALFQPRHYRAAANMLRVYEAPGNAVWRYLFAQGAYPIAIGLRTPEGPLTLRLQSPADLLTVNEIFCRHDYPAAADDRVVVDFGSNIGVSAAYFLTRHSRSFVYLFEPLDRNIAELRYNLKPFTGRFALSQVAVGLHTGLAEFGYEPTGRYGGIGRQTGRSVAVPCRDAAGILREIVEKEGAIDILKIDIETLEKPLLLRIPLDVRREIRTIYVEQRFTENPITDTHAFRQYGSVAQFTRLTES